MVRSKLGLKALGLSVMVLGLMAFATGGVAQAETGASWTYINSKGELLAFSESLLPEVAAKLEGTSASLDFTTGGGTKVKFRCTAFALTGSPKLLLNGSISNGAATFTGCETFLNESEKASAACLPKTKGAAADEIKTNTAHGLLVLHKLANGTLHHVVLLIPLVTDPKTGEPLAATLELGEECSIGSSVPITGHLVLWDCPPFTGLEHLVEHLIEEFPGLRLLKALGKPATVLGTALARLINAHAGLKWAGLTKKA